MRQRASTGREVGPRLQRLLNCCPVVGRVFRASFSAWQPSGAGAFSRHTPPPRCGGRGPGLARGWGVATAWKASVGPPGSGPGSQERGIRACSLLRHARGCCRLTSRDAAPGVRDRKPQATAVPCAPFCELLGPGLVGAGRCPTTSGVVVRAAVLAGTPVAW